jgi:hypothetical protein
VRRTASFVQADLEEITSKSPFLQRPLPCHSNVLAYFDHNEIKTGKLLGRGGFSVVYEIVAFELDEDLSNRLVPESYQAIREQFASTAIDPSTGRGRYVIKHLQDYLLNRQTEFSLAASDLALEATYLSRMEHPHIVPLRGLPATGLDAQENGQHDGYSLILDRLHEALDQRISSSQQ